MQFTNTLQPTINLIHHIGLRVCRPVSTSLCHNHGDGDILLDIGRPLQNVRIQAGTDMPCDVAVERPDTRVVSVYLPHNVPVGREKLDVTTLWIVGIGDRDTIPVSWSLVENEHIVAVKMHRVSCGGRVVDDDSDGGVGSEILDIPLGLVAEVALVSQQKDRVVVICAECLVVESPEERSCCIDNKVDIQAAGRGWFRNGCQCKIRLGEGEIIILTNSLGDVPCGGCRRFCSIGFVVVNGSKRIALVTNRAELGDIGTHPKCGFGLSLICGHKDIRSLTSGKGNHVSGIWFLLFVSEWHILKASSTHDRNKIVCNDGHVVAINAKALKTFRSTIDQP